MKVYFLQITETKKGNYPNPFSFQLYKIQNINKTTPETYGISSWSCRSKLLRTSAKLRLDYKLSNQEIRSYCTSYENTFLSIDSANTGEEALQRHIEGN